MVDYRNLWDIKEYISTMVEESKLVNQQFELFGEDKQLHLLGDAKKRVIVEGGFQDDWSKLSSVCPIEVVMGDDMSRINFRSYGMRPVRLTHVYNWVGTEWLPVDPFEDKIVECNIENNTLQIVSSLITEDGKIFFDVSLYKDKSERNRNRLDIFRERLREVVSSYTNPIHLFFTEKGRERFRRSAIEIYL